MPRANRHDILGHFRSITNIAKEGACVNVLAETFGDRAKGREMIGTRGTRRPSRK